MRKKTPLHAFKCGNVRSSWGALDSNIVCEYSAGEKTPVMKTGVKHIMQESYIRFREEKKAEYALALLNQMIAETSDI